MEEYRPPIENTFLLENGEQKEKYALILLVKEIFSQIDEVACLKSKGSKAGISMELLREVCSVLTDLDDQQREEYIKILISLADHAAEPSYASYNEEYAENVANAKQRFVEKIRTVLHKKAA